MTMRGHNKGGQVRAIVFDLGHTIIDFGPAEDALRDAYLQVLTMLASTARAELPSAEAMIRSVTRRIFGEINESYGREELEELDILRLFDAALRAPRLPSRRADGARDRRNGAPRAGAG